MHYAKLQTVMTALLYHQSPGTFANDLMVFHCVEEKINQSTKSSGFFPCASIFRNARVITLVVKNLTHSCKSGRLRSHLDFVKNSFAYTCI